MPDYVYALHDFQPENEDEVDFRAGEPIEVIERDDQYSDGWWQGRNLAGKIGLFPKSYTTPAAPARPRASSLESSAGPSMNGPPDILQPVDEEAGSFIGSDADSNIGVALGEPPSGHQEEVMQATMTDVQKAIEQLGQHDRDGTRSFSFASTRHGDTDRETDTDGDTSLRDDGEDWHRSARDKLAEQARKVVEAKAATEVEIRSLAPPIDIEMSDESEVEDVDDAFQNVHRFARDHPHIPEEDEEDNDNNGAVTLSHRRRNLSMTSPVTLPLQDLPSLSSNDGEQTAKVHKTSFSVTSTIRTISPAPTGHEHNGSQSRSAPVSPMVNIFAPVPVIAVEPSSIQLPASPEPTTHATPTPVIREIRQVSSAVSSPTPRVVSPPPTSKHNSVASSGQVSTTSMPQTSSEPTQESSLMKSVSPSEWSVEEVVDWLRSKNFGQDVCDKFIEQEITGDVLLELDINLLKVEIGIVAFGKRMRIANAIAELRRPPSIIFPDAQSPQHPQSLSHSHSYSYTHSRSGSTQQSLNSPMFTTTMSSAITAPNSATFGSMCSTESPAADTSQFAERVSSLSSTGLNIIGGSPENHVSTGTVGLGLGAPPNGDDHKRTASGQLGPSPSDGALNKRSQEDAPEPEELQDDDRGALSEGENVPSVAKQRLHLFGRSTESTSTAKEKGGTSSNNNSTTALSTSVPLASAVVTPRSSRKRELLDDSSIGSKHSRNKRDATTKGTERHSLFGGAFTTSLGKSRKPPPRISPSLIDTESPMEKSSSLNLSRLYGNKKPSGRPSTSDGSPSSTLRNPSRSDSLDEKKLREKEKTSEKLRGKDADSQTLKKKESLKKHVDGHESQSRGPNTFKPGQSIIDQIGTPDHQGWMRKKGDHYNAWKVRYFVIKGPHLYILRSDNKTEVKIKGYINIIGYKVIADENVDPGRYGFRIVHETDKTHFFSSDEQIVVREWMKAIMKATIGRDYSKPVVSSVNIPTIPLTVAQAMNPAPRPPSPTARDATQKALRRENPNQLSSRDARVLMGLPSSDGNDAQDSERTHLDSFFTEQSISSQPEDEPKVANQAPPRPTREARPSPTTALNPSDTDLVEWANSHLPAALKNYDLTGHLFSGLALLRLSESVLGKSPSPPVPDSAFPSGPDDDKLDGLFRLFDFLLDNDVKMGSVSINDVRRGKHDKILQLLKALKAWEDRRMDILRSIGAGTIQAGPFVTPDMNTWKR
ncbi:hypothetical protein DFJ58DRAFT_721902 [Suillus subalutaceus]|uniref:uncharacterized protein n=1 Tax=Suillus subalutaceus TaxID=48586 RepID=UPI001B876ABF|nr:uncharacterized protein DFJ58DRAFT_721902 [Suillus subalutaceus]KAG1873618.1 hypothetical protein DFJ58DRAFT_721902 [Suillus subalutaceus]